MDPSTFFAGNESVLSQLKATTKNQFHALSVKLNHSHLQLPNEDQIYEQWAPLQAKLISITNDLTVAQIAVIIVVAIWLLAPLFRRTPKVTNAQVHGYRSWAEPTVSVQARFIFSAHKLVTSGFRKYKDKPFILKRWDNNITVFPNKYLNEIRLIPATKLNCVKAVIDDLVPRWVYGQCVMESNLHTRVLHNKLTPELHQRLDISRQELEYGWDIEVPQAEDWTEVDIQQIFRKLVARITAKSFTGYPACRNEEWLSLSIIFSIDLFATSFTLRMFPPWMHPIVAPINPARWRLKRNIDRAQVILEPLMEQHKEALRRRAAGEEVHEENSLLNWMMDNGNAEETEVRNFVTRQCFLTIASIHTTSMALTNLLFDLTANPQYFKPIIDELEEVEQAMGKLGTVESIGCKEYLPKLEKLDSAFVESQRFSPPILLSANRVALQPVTLKDGTHIPVGTRLACANVDILNDTIGNPVEYDAFRWYNKRHETGELHKYQAGQTEKSNLHFGYGNQACPGRHFAVGEIKLVMMRLLKEYEFKFPKGKGRPRNFYADEKIVPDPRAKIMMRKRRIPCDHCGRTD